MKTICSFIDRQPLAYRAFLLYTFLFLTPVNQANAETITEITPLDFGIIALKDNLASYQIQVRYTGQIINDPEIVIISDGQPAEYFLSGFPASTLMNITVTSPSGVVSAPASGDPANQTFTISNFDYIPSVTSNALGELTLFIGATLTTSGVGTYTDSLYVTTINVNISY